MVYWQEDVGTARAGASDFARVSAFAPHERTCIPFALHTGPKASLIRNITQSNCKGSHK